MKKILKGIATFFKVLGIAIVIYLFSNSIYSLAKGKIPAIFNYNFFIVETNSMEDSIKVNDLVISKINKIEDVKENDVITFICVDEEQVIVGQVITHRVVKVEYIDDEIFLTTKGDNNQINDRLKVSKENYLGKVVAVSSFFGNIIKLFSSVKMLLILIVTVISLIFMIIQIKKYVLKKKEEDRINKLKEEILNEIKNEKEGI